MIRLGAIAFFALSGLFLLLQTLNSAVAQKLSFSPALPDGYQKNSWTAQSATVSGGKYVFTYKFKDHTGAIKTWSWSTDKAGSDAAAKKYGVPSSFFEPYENKPDVISARNKLVSDGMCVVSYEGGNTIFDINYSAVAIYYKTWANSLYSVWKKNGAGLAFRKRVDQLLSFLQDIPYGTPPIIYEGRCIVGCFPPPVMCKLMWGDCDCKSVLFASVLLNEEGFNPIILRDLGHTHIFAGVEAIPAAYDTKVSYMGKTYVICDPTGTAHLKMGQFFQGYTITHYFPTDGDTSGDDDETATSENDDDEATETDDDDEQDVETGEDDDTSTESEDDDENDDDNDDKDDEAEEDE